MTGWNAEDVAKIGTAVEFEIASRRADGSLRPCVWDPAAISEVIAASG